LKNTGRILVSPTLFGTKCCRYISFKSVCLHS